MLDSLRKEGGTGAQTPVAASVCSGAQSLWRRHPQAGPSCCRWAVESLCWGHKAQGSWGIPAAPTLCCVPSRCCATSLAL